MKLLPLIIFFALVSQINAQLGCDYCLQEISGKYIILNENIYHKECYRNHIQFRCHHCGDLIEGKYNIVDDKQYHLGCFRDNILQKCDICNLPIAGTYFTDFWGNTWHTYHSDQLVNCSSCGRLISEALTDGGTNLNDGRHLCNLCNQTAVNDVYIAESSLDIVKKILASNGIDGLPNNIPISLVDMRTLKKISTAYSESMQGFTSHEIQSQNGEIVSKESHIYILSDLPLIMFRAVLAHELMHVYLFEQGLDLKSDIREGFCNLGSALVYQNYRSKYSSYKLVNMQQDPDFDYGEGYRKMAHHLEQKGWWELLESLETIK